MQAEVTEIMQVAAMGNSLTNNQAKILLDAYQEQQADLKLLKDNIYKVLAELAIVNPDGTLRGKPDIKKLTGAAMQLVLNPGKLADKFSFLTELTPLIEKYKDL
jgi:hypothetical protein